MIEKEDIKTDAIEIWTYLRPKVIAEIERMLNESESTNIPKHPYCSNLNPKFFVKEKE